VAVKSLGPKTHVIDVKQYVQYLPTLILASSVLISGFNMNGKPVCFQVAQRGGAMLFLIVAAGVAMGSEVNVTHTNSVDRWITNVIEVRVPKNVFVSEVHTNWIEHRSTNVIPAYATNKVVRTITNVVPVEVYSTNFVNGYRTNWRSVTLTREVPVEMFETNFVAHYRTNWKTLHLTNWVTVLVMKTNWVTADITNVVDIDVAGTRPSTKDTPPAQPAAQKEAPAQESQTEVVTSGLTLEASKTAVFPGRNHVEVELKVKSADSAVQVHQWRVERDDGTILCFGQDPEFRRDLPVGKYKVEVKVQREANGPLLATRGALAITSDDALIRQ
jgi:hypothetical protein